MNGIFNRAELQDVLKNFYTALKVRSAIFDDEYNVIANYPSTHPSYCARIQESADGAAGCKNCDAEACKTAKALGHVHIYTCHAGLIEAVTPIVIEGETIGYALLSHISNLDDFNENVKRAHELNKKYGLSYSETELLMTELKSTTTPMNEETIHAVANILEALVSYICTKNFVKKNYNLMESELKEYIKSHISEKLNCNTICKHFNISRSYLFKISKKYFGVGISEYISNKRTSLACKYLLEGKNPDLVSELCGFSDICYFYKVFKAKFGITPREYIRNNFTQ